MTSELGPLASNEFLN